jgi:prevent-host-death family protein
MAAKALTVTEVRDSLGDVVSRAVYGRERVPILRHGKPAAAIIPWEDLTLLEALEDHADVEAARKALDEPGSIPWERVKTDLGL